MDHRLSVANFSQQQAILQSPRSVPVAELWCNRSECCVMGWLRLVGSLKLHVSFAEYRLFYKALLQKRPVILRSLLIVATPYVLWGGFD